MLTLGIALIRVPAWGSMNLVEAIWLSSGLFAIFFTGKHVVPLYDDWHDAKVLSRPILSAVAWGYLRRELVRMAQGFCLSVIGVYAALQPSALPNHKDYVSIVGLVLTGVLMAQAFLVALQSYWDWGTRKDVQALIEITNGVAPETT